MFIAAHLRDPLVPPPLAMRSIRASSDDEEFRTAVDRRSAACNSMAVCVAVRHTAAGRNDCAVHAVGRESTRQPHRRENSWPEATSPMDGGLLTLQVNKLTELCLWRFVCSLRLGVALRSACLAIQPGGRLQCGGGVQVRRILTIVFSLGAILALTAPARASDFTWNFTGTGAQTGLAATAVFHDAGGGNLQITLTNTGTVDTSPGNTLSALLFNCNCGTLSPVSAITSGPVFNSGSQVFPTGTNVGGEWAYGLQTDVGSTQLITSMGGFNSFTGPNNGPGNFGGSDLDNLQALDGIDFGIVPTGVTTISGNAVDLIQHDVIFTLSGFNGDLSHVANVGFQYGTSSGEFNSGGGTGTGSGGGSGQNVVPEPTSLLLFGSGLAMTAYRTRRKAKQQKDS